MTCAYRLLKISYITISTHKERLTRLQSQSAKLTPRCCKLDQSGCISCDMAGVCTAFSKDYKKDESALNVTGYFDGVSFESTDTSQLNIGAIVGAVVGVVLCIVAAALITTCYRQRKKRSQPGHNVTPVDATDGDYMHRVSNPIRREIKAANIPMAEEADNATTLVGRDGKLA